MVECAQPPQAPIEHVNNTVSPCMLPHRGYVVFPKSRRGTTDGLQETGLTEKKENELERRKGEGKS